MNEFSKSDLVSIEIRLNTIQAELKAQQETTKVNHDVNRNSIHSILNKMQIAANEEFQYKLTLQELIGELKALPGIVEKIATECTVRADKMAKDIQTLLLWRERWLGIGVAMGIIYSIVSGLVFAGVEEALRVYFKK